MRVALLGGLSVESEHGRLSEDDLPGRQARLILACLVAEPSRPIPRSELANVLWGDQLPATWEKSLTVVISRLRNALSSAGLDDSIRLRNAFGCYQLELPVGTKVDILQARASVLTAERLLAGDHHDAAGIAAARALDDCGGDLLPGESGSWVDARRDEIHELQLRALACASEAAIRRGDVATAVATAKQAVERDPFGETRVALLMRAYAAAGERAQALRVYDDYRRRLADELGVDPSPETQELYTRLLLEDRVAVPRQALPEAATTTEPELLAPGSVATKEPMRAPSWRLPRGRRRWLALIVIVALAAASGVAVLLTDGHASPRPAPADSLALLTTSGVRQSVALPGTPGALAFGLGSDWVADPGDATVVRVDERSGQIRGQFPIGGRPTGIATTADAVWVTQDNGRVLRLDPSTGRVIQSVAVGDGPAAVVSGAGAIWVANSLDATVSEIDVRSGRLVRSIDVPVGPTALAYGFGSVWVVSSTAQSLSRIDATSGQVSQTVTIGGAPVAVVAGQESVYIADQTERAIRRVDPRSGQIVDTVDLPFTPVGVATAAGRVWAAGGVTGVVASVDARTLTQLRTRREAGDADALTATPEGVALAVGAPISSHLGGTLTVVGGENPGPPSLDANASYDPLADQLLVQVGDGLLGFARTSGLEGTALVPDLASYIPTATDGGLTYTFQLRQGIRFSDGSLLTASSIRRGIERALSLQQTAPQLYGAIRGAERCTVGHPCSLSAGVDAVDTTGTVTFHLRHRDDQFLEGLAFPMGFAVPASTPFTDETRRPPPMTGPYRVTSYDPGRRAVLDRNPYFHQWSAAAQPAGYPDHIVWTATPSRPGSVADVTLTQTGAAVTNSILNEPSDVHFYRQALVFFAYLNTQVAPFNDVRVRRAVNYAIDRGEAVRLLGGFTAAEPTCQVIPAGFPGYHPYCPYPGPQLTKARALVRAAHAENASVQVLATAQFQPFDHYLVQVLNGIGLRATERVVSMDRMFNEIYAPHPRVQASSYGWLNDLPSPAYNLPVLFSCAARLGSSPSNTSGYCNPALDRAMSVASHLEATDSPLASHRWASIDQQLTDAAVEVPVADLHGIDLVSGRVHNYQGHPLFGLLLDQLWH